MSSAGNTFENQLALLLFQNANVADIGDATGLRGSTAAGSLYVALHSSDPGEAGDQATNEVAYTGYARAAVARSAAGWNVVANAISNAAAIAWPLCSGGSAVATHFSIGTLGSGAGKVLVRGALSPSITVSSGVTPTLQVGELSGTID